MIKESNNANEKQSTASLSPREQAEDRSGVREGHAEGEEAACQGIPAEDVEVHFFEWHRQNQSTEERQEQELLSDKWLDIVK